MDTILSVTSKVLNDVIFYSYIYHTHIPIKQEYNDKNAITDCNGWE